VPFVEKAFASVTASVKWLSCEPLLEPLQFERLDLFQWIVLGGASRSTETPDFRPPRRWITDLERQAIDAGCKVYEKTNLLERLRQYPGAQSTVDVDVPVEFKMGYLQRDLKDWQTYEREVTR
jgi:protein gp37